MSAEPLITWPDPLIELIGFVGTFLGAGAVGFRFAALRGLPEAGASEPEVRAVRDAAAGAAGIGLLGTLITAALLAASLPDSAAHKHLSIMAFIMSNQATLLTVVLVALALVGFALARARVAGGWPLAAIAVVAQPLLPLLRGQLQRLVNPLHRFSAGLWIGTLFVMIVIGFRTALASSLAADRRGRLTARMVAGFSPLALCSVALLGSLGVVTAWTHLKKLDALWTTPYGYALIAKLCVVAAVLGFGAFNWKKQTANLGTVEGARRMQRTAGVELTLAVVVLMITAILVSLPGPGE